MTSFALASGKGGVGKSTMALNLGILLVQPGRRVVVVDADVRMPSLGILMGIDQTPISLNNVLRQQNEITEAIYDGPGGVKFVPANIALENEELDYNILPRAVRKLEEIYDIVIVDCPPGLAEDAIAAITSAKELIMVLTPEPISLADALKVQINAERNSVKISGFVLNRVLGDKSEIKKEELESILKLKCLSSLPEDLEVRKASMSQTPVAIKSPGAPFTKSLRNFALVLMPPSPGAQTAASAQPRKGGLFSGLREFFRKLFGGKPKPSPAAATIQKQLQPARAAQQGKPPEFKEVEFLRK